MNLQLIWFSLSSNTQGLTDGGLAGLFWSYLWTFIGFAFVIFSLGEMASMWVGILSPLSLARCSKARPTRAPISGGQYHWVSEFAPPQYQKPLSYITGKYSILDTLEKETDHEIRMDVSALVASRHRIGFLSHRDDNSGVDSCQQPKLLREEMARNIAGVRHGDVHLCL